jgi:hypothetical protein
MYLYSLYQNIALLMNKKRYLGTVFTSSKLSLREGRFLPDEAVSGHKNEIASASARLRKDGWWRACESPAPTRGITPKTIVKFRGKSRFPWVITQAGFGNDFPRKFLVEILSALHRERRVFQPAFLQCALYRV